MLYLLEPFKSDLVHKEHDCGQRDAISNPVGRSQDGDVRNETIYKEQSRQLVKPVFLNRRKKTTIYRISVLYVLHI